MSCRNLEQTDFDNARLRMEQQSLYAPAPTGRAAIHFQFNLAPLETAKSLFVIYSNRSRAAVYRGAYQPSLTVPMDDRLAADRGFDNLDFRLLDLARKRVCIWANERGEPYWRPGAQITIGILSEPSLDQDGLPKSFDVTIK